MAAGMGKPRKPAFTRGPWGFGKRETDFGHDNAGESQAVIPS